MQENITALPEKSENLKAAELVQRNCFRLLKDHIKPCRGMPGKGCSL